MLLSELYQRVDVVAARLRRVRRRTAIARSAALAAVVGAVGYAIALFAPSTAAVVQVGFAMSAVALAFAAWNVGRSRPSDFSLAVREIEKQFPELQSRLLTAVEQHPDLATGRFNFLQSRLIADVLEHARHADWSVVVSPQILRRAWRRQGAAFAGLLIVFAGLLSLPAVSGSSAAARLSGQELTDGHRADYVVDPGDVQAERRQSLLVLLRFRSMPPRDVELIWRPADGEAERIKMTKSLDDPVFAGRLPSVTGDGTYHLEFDGASTPAYHVAVYDLPTLVESTIIIEPPAYTHREPQVLESAASATLVEGSRLRLQCRVNKPLARAELRDEKDGTAIPLSPEAADARSYVAEWQPDRSRRFRLALMDAEGRTNRDPDEFAIDVVPNRRPDVKIVFPGQDQRVSPLQELTLEARAGDDFGIEESGLVIDMPDGRQETIRWTNALPGGEAHPLVHLLALEELRVQPGEVVSYAFFADDIGPDGGRRRTMGDLFFLEIRPYDESYREMEGAGGQSGQQGQSGSQNQSLDRVIELQKQIVSATWNLQRRDPDLSLSDEQAVVETLLDSQEQAREQFESLAEAMEGAVPAERISSVFDSMGRAIDEFTSTRDETEGKANHLEKALQAVRAAFQGLIRLKPTDHRLVQGGQSGGGAGGGGSISQQQLDQLELSEDANRYETEKTARAGGDPSGQREQLAVLNRLKELAQRQQGLNEKLKELDAELRTAQTAAEREELERQLKQLRDEQHDLLQDADALRNRLQQSADPSRTADTRRQLEETRQQLVDASESLREGKLSQALSSGARAERDLKQMQEDFRKKTSAQLAQTLQDLKNQARELTETQEGIEKDLSRLGDRNDKSLRHRQDRQKLAESLQEQRTRLQDMLKSLRAIVQEAESSEPLAAKKLYEAARNAQQQKTEEALQAASQLIQRGFLPEATQVEQLARTGLQTLRDGIEEAAEAILGDEVEAMKQARRELAELSEELQREMEKARGGGETARKSSPEGEPRSSSPSAEEGTANESESSGATSEDSSADANAASSADSSANDANTTSPGSEKPGLRGGPKRRSKGTDQPGSGTSQSSPSQGGQSGGPGGEGGPLTGSNFTNWIDRLRDVETLLNDPELQADVSKVREEARSIRAEFKRHSKTPNWDLVEQDVRKPLVELQQRLAEEISKRESPDSLAPTDRDPVPERYRELVRKYYERLGSGAK